MTADTEYIMAYKSTTGSYSATVNGFGSGLSVGNLRTASDAGAYSYTNDFPSARSRASYLVDVVVQYPDPPFVAGAQAPLPGSSSVALDATVSATLSKAAAGSSVALTLTGPGSVEVPGTASYDAPTGRVTFTPAAPLAAATSYTATLTATSTTGQALSAGGTWTFTTVPSPRPDGVCPCSLYQDSVTPGVPDFNDGVPLTLGVRFASDSPGRSRASATTSRRAIPEPTPGPCTPLTASNWRRSRSPANPPPGGRRPPSASLWTSQRTPNTWPRTARLPGCTRRHREVLVPESPAGRCARHPAPTPTTATFRHPPRAPVTSWTWTSS